MTDDENVLGGDLFYVPADEEHVKRERAKAREMRSSQWWKNVRGRGSCHYCKAKVPPAELTMDHIVPVIRGGKSSKGNVVPCCKDCNSQKQSMVPVEWQAHLQRLRDQ
jgi:5-methylcytosine-specific restriction endonuclease McrA